jgi:hypothetical protein
VIAAVGYDLQTQTLEVEFHSGDVYQYLDVSELDARRLLHAESMGRVLNERIKPRYKVIEITD